MIDEQSEEGKTRESKPHTVTDGNEIMRMKDKER